MVLDVGVTTENGRAVGVVPSPLLRVREDLIRRLDLGELRRGCIFIAKVPVWMKLQSPLSVRLFDSMAPVSPYGADIVVRPGTYSSSVAWGSTRRSS